MSKVTLRREQVAHVHRMKKATSIQSSFEIERALSATVVLEESSVSGTELHEVLKVVTNVYRDKMPADGVNDLAALGGCVRDVRHVDELGHVEGWFEGVGISSRGEEVLPQTIIPGGEGYDRMSRKGDV